MIVIAFPRIYLGLHYPTDILVGAIVGITIAVIGNKLLYKNWIINKILDLSAKKTNIFYAIFFLFSRQIADLFTDSYGLTRSLIKFIMN